MPLFMDFHQFGHITMEDVKSAHVTDTAIQERYGVKYHQFWVNEHRGLVFCLMEGPDKATCEQVLHLTQGNKPFSLTEVEPAFYKKVAGDWEQEGIGLLDQKTKKDLDLGYRNVLVVKLKASINTLNHRQLERAAVPIWSRKIVHKEFLHFNGRQISWPADDSQIAVFNQTLDALHCAKSIQKQVLRDSKNSSCVIVKIGISASLPTKGTGNILQSTVELAHRLCSACQDNQILITQLAGKLYNGHTNLNSTSIKCLGQDEESFISKVFGIAEDMLADHAFTISDLSKSLGMSRPQLYRKIIHITGKSPNYFLRDIRLEKARSLLRQKAGNVAQIANEVGYSNPSYFSKCFSEKFGINPSHIHG